MGNEEEDAEGDDSVEDKEVTGDGTETALCEGVVAVCIGDGRVGCAVTSIILFQDVDIT